MKAPQVLITLHGHRVGKIRSRLYTPTSLAKRNRFDRARAVIDAPGFPVVIFNGATGRWLTPQRDALMRSMGLNRVDGHMDRPIRNALRA